MLTIPPHQKWFISIAFMLLLIIIALVSEPIPQDPAYHLLADNRYGLSIPNLADVVSNLPFAVVGFIGLTFCQENKHTILLSWQVFFAGLILVALGSSYYHLNPNNETLVWDRLPMMISFMGLFTALVTENISIHAEKKLLPAAVSIGLFSVIYWHYTDDLRLYALTQFGTLSAIPAIFYFYQSRYTHRNYLLYGLCFYIAAKVFELTDTFMFELTGHLLSGHTIKHLLAAAATYCVYLMLIKRQAIQNKPT